VPFIAKCLSAASISKVFLEFWFPYKAL
jgi:hypothetical protein